MIRKVLTTLEEVQNWFSPLKSAYAFDWETTGLNYLKMEPVGISFCDGEKACYIDLEDKNADILNYLCNIFNSSSTLFIAHNAKFDINCCFKFCNSIPKNIFCTFMAAFVLDENRTSYKLKVIIQEDLHIPASMVQKWETVDSLGHDTEEWYEYCFNDSIWAYGLYQLYSYGLKKQNLEYLFYEIEMPFIPVLSYMERTGVLVDKERLQTMQDDLEKQISATEVELLELLGLEPDVEFDLFGNATTTLPINFNSPQQMTKAFEDLGVEVPLNKKKKKSLDKKLLDPLENKYPVVKKYLEYKSLQKLLSGYVLPAWKLMDEDGRVRSSFGMAVTGRLTCSKPNRQNMPRPPKDKPELNFRSVNCAEEGKVLLAPDYSGQELRLLGVVTNDAVIIDAFDRNLDLHLLTANNCFNLNLSTKQLTNGTKEFEEAKEKYAEERYKAKNGANFPIIYGTTAYGVSWRQGVDLREAQRWIDNFFNLYPNVKKAMEETRKELESRGWVCTLYGRRRRFPTYKRESPFKKEAMLRQAFNFKIQGSAADQIKIAMAKIYQRGISIILMVHDEVVCEVPEKDAERIGKEIQTIMEECVSFRIKFKVDYKIASNYGELK